MDLKRLIYLFNQELEDKDILRNLRKMGMKVGEKTIFKTTFYGQYPYLISIGKNCCICDNVYFFNKEDSSNWIMKDVLPSHAVFGTIEIGNNCYISEYTILLPGTIIGDNTVVQPGSILQGNFVNETSLSGILIKTTDVYKNNQTLQE